MHKLPRSLFAFAAVAALSLLPSHLSAATGEVTQSGSTYTGKVDGVTRYTGTSLISAVHACRDNMSSGTINLRAGGGVGSGQIEFRGKSNVSLNANGNTVSGSPSGDTATILFRSNSNSHLSNIRLTGDKLYGVRFTGVSGFSTTGVTGACGVLIRADGSGSSAQFNNVNGTATSDRNPGNEHALETYLVSTVRWATVTGTDRKGGCGLLLNTSTNCVGTNVNGTRCDDGGGYAGTRMANTNNDMRLTGTATSRDCGRGLFSTTGSNDGSVARINATSSTSHGVWFQDSPRTIAHAGSLTGNGVCKYISGSSSGSAIYATCN